MLNIKIDINGAKIAHIKVQNVSERHGVLYGKGMQFYEVVGKDITLTHKFEDGYEKLVKTVLNKLTEEKDEDYGI